MAHQEPTNPRLWNMIIAQAKARFATYPSPGASHWVHSQYVKHGGQFTDVSTKTRQEKMAKKHFEEKKREQLAARSEKTKKLNKKGDKKKGDK
jgi:hypothetical protein